MLPLGSKQDTSRVIATVYSVCPHTKENIQFIFSTGIDGKIKAWLYDNLGSRADYDAPGHSYTTMAYSADGTRLFSCGTSKEGESYIVKWNESEGGISGHIRKEHLLVVSTSENGVKILANFDGVRLLRSIESRALDASRMAFESAAKIEMLQ
ncbi:Protein TPR3 [Camellia lanceoleosa]|uniref:Protein TPR3 n=1 Tax=Camellia lanceoleosa TaxID=1840588 RepID=A0ACC0FVP6_9ERIC|nr:Protein TPR3 [Camellia lanceoleosa]